MIRKVFPVLALAIFASMLGSGIVVPLLPVYAESMGASGIWLGVIFAAFAISQAALMPLAGRLSDRHGRKLFISVGLLIYAALSFVYIWSNSIIGLIFLRLAQGAAEPSLRPSPNHISATYRRGAKRANGWASLTPPFSPAGVSGLCWEG